VRQVDPHALLSLATCAPLALDERVSSPKGTVRNDVTVDKWWWSYILVVLPKTVVWERRDADPFRRFVALDRSNQIGERVGERR
jgi:hypothetical protein